MGNEDEDRARVYGVTFGPLKRALREHQYPVTAGELVEQYGGFELETEAGSERLEAVLHRSDETTFTEPWEVRDAILDGLDDDAVVGRDGDGDDDGTSTDAAGDWSRLSA